MKRILFTIISLGILPVSLSAQLVPRIDDNVRSKTVDTSNIYNKIGNNQGREYTLTEIKEHYRAPLKKELALVAVDQNTAAKYADFLKQKETGLVRLMPDFGCSGLTSKKPDEEMCKKFTMPGNGAAYSFRKKNYQLWELADLLFDGANFYSLGGLSQGFLVSLGNLSLESVTLQTAGLDYVTKFVPATGMDEAIEQNNKLAEGIKADGFYYRKVLPVTENATYVLRSVAYNGEVKRTFKKILYNELDYDVRKDVIVAFQVVAAEQDGSVTILWKRLSQNDAPTLKD